MTFAISAFDDLPAVARHLFGAGFSAAPALMVVLAALVVLPVLAGIGAVVMWRFRRTVAPPTPASRSDPASDPDGPTLAWKAEKASARLSVDGVPAAVMSPARPIVRIGRNEDNDIRIEAESAHRYHAIVHRGDDGRYWIVDLSGADGNGLTVDGARTARARLKGGETIDIGGRRLTFEWGNPAKRATGAVLNA